MNDDSRFTVKTFKKISEIPKSDWDAVFPPILESYNFFKTMDETLDHQFNPYYITVYEGKRIVCAAPCVTMEYPLDTTVEGPVKKIIRRIRRRIPRFFITRALICGSAASEGRIGIRDENHKDIVKVFVEEMLSIAKEERALIIAFKDFNEHYSKYLDPLLKIGFYKISSYPSVRLDINFKSFEEYFASLSKATRKDLKRKFRKSDGVVKMDIEVRDSLGEMLDEAYELYLNTLKKSEVHFEILSKEFFKKIPENMAEETKYFLWFIDGKLVAFDLCLVSEGRLIDEYMGMDYGAAYKYHLYFITFRDIITWCIKNNVRSYETGALNYDPKKRLDFKFIPQYIYARTKNLFINKLFGLLIMLIKPENFEGSIKRVKKAEER